MTRKPWLPAVLLFAVVVPHSSGGGAAPRRPLLVSVDDLPIAGALHDSRAERREITRKLLAALARHRIQAVGLVTWKNVRDESDLELLRKWLDTGHELGNHSWDHLSYTATDQRTYVADAERARARLEEFLRPRGLRPRFFRFPFLREGDTQEKLDAMRSYLETSGQSNLPVTIDNDDWTFAEPWVKARRAGDREAMEDVGVEYLESLRGAVRSGEAAGDRLFGRAVPQVLLLHANEVGGAQWDALFRWLVETGHRFASADEVLADTAFREPHRFVGEHGPGLWDRIHHDRQVKAARAEVQALLEEQAEAWNRGDLLEFCSVYDDDAVFASPTGFHRGRAQVLERYRKRYPDRAAMGTLSFEFLDVRAAWSMGAPGDIRALSVVARWTLAYPDREPASGLTLVVLRRRVSGWAIVQDASM